MIRSMTNAQTTLDQTQAPEDAAALLESARLHLAKALDISARALCKKDYQEYLESHARRVSAITLSLARLARLTAPEDEKGGGGAKRGSSRQTPAPSHIEPFSPLPLGAGNPAPDGAADGGSTPTVIADAFPSSVGREVSVKGAQAEQDFSDGALTPDLSPSGRGATDVSPDDNPGSTPALQASDAPAENPNVAAFLAALQTAAAKMGVPTPKVCVYSDAGDFDPEFDDAPDAEELASAFASAVETAAKDQLQEQPRAGEEPAGPVLTRQVLAAALDGAPDGDALELDGDDVERVLTGQPPASQTPMPDGAADATSSSTRQTPTSDPAAHADQRAPP
jgi:hypothetical protein